MQSKSFTLDFAGKTLTAEFTDLAEQASGSVLLKLEETAILVTVTMSDQKSDLHHLPLSVEFAEAALSARTVERTIRPLFDHSIRHKIQVVVTVLAVGEDDPDVLAIIGTSLALGVSHIPWAGPVGAVRIGQRKSDGDILINPDYADRIDGQLSFEVLTCGKDGKINMIETEAEEVTEPDMLAVLEATTTMHEPVVAWQREIIADIGIEKTVFEKPEVPRQVAELFEKQFKQTLEEVTFSARPGNDHIYELKHVFVETASELDVDETIAREYFEEQIDNTLHEGALTSEKRADGRKLDEVRPLFAKAGGISSALHGSGIFYLGGTRSFSALTLGDPKAGRASELSRNMIGHGVLAKKALRPLIPSQELFSSTIRLVSKTLSNKGSSSMGSVCASTIALMDGGVPIIRPVAGIASGLMMRGDQYAIVTDIQGPEDECSDMNFKVAGTSDGITAMEMTVKVGGIPIHILRDALDKTRSARLHILKTIQTEIAEPRNKNLTDSEKVKN